MARACNQHSCPPDLNREKTFRANHFTHHFTHLAARPLVGEQLATQSRFWPEGWWKLMEYRIGIIPLPVYVMLLALIAGFAITGKVPGEISMAIAVLAFFGFTCAELGKRLPIVRASAPPRFSRPSFRPR